MTTLGINVVADGSHPPEWVTSLGATSLRIVLTPQHDLEAYFQRCQADGVSILGLIARESAPSDYQLADYSVRYGRYLTRVQYGNESDHESPSSWTMTPAELSALGWQVKRAFRDHPLVCAGMVSGNPAYLDGVDLRMADAIAVHPYAKDLTRGNDLPDADVLVSQYQRFGKPIVISEWGWWGDEEDGAERVGDMVRWAASTDMIDSYYHFCLSDTMVPPFGLLRDDSTWKPAAYAFRDAAEQDSSPDVPWIGPGIQAELDRQGWTPTSGEHRTTWPVVWAKTASGIDAVIVWNEAEGAAVPYRRVR